MQNDYWQPIAIAEKVKVNQVYPVWLMDKPWVLFRDTSGKAILLDDTCPHRFASLSNGKIIQGEIQCPYHGWQFNSQGVCTRVPGLQKLLCEKPLLQTQLVVEREGLIWITDKISKFNAPLSAAQDILQDHFFIQAEVQSDLITLVENFLDGFHTHFVHAGWIRCDKDRQKLTAEIKPLIDGIEINYSGETNQSGFLSRWLEPERGCSYARFRLPNFAEIEYRSKKNSLSLLVSLWAVSARDDCLSVIVRVATQKGFLPAWIKQVILKKLFKKIQQQDKQIVEQVFARKKLLNNAGDVRKSLSTELDLFHPWLQEIIHTKQVPNFNPQIREISL